MEMPWSKRTRRRAAERYRPAGLRCDLGDVVDLSASGARLSLDARHACDIGSLLTLTLTPADGSGTVRVTGHAVWSKRTGVRRKEVGVSFVRLRPSTAARLETLARTGSLAGAPDIDDATAYGTGWQADFSHEPTADAEHRAALGVSASATLPEIQAAFRKLARRYHPDRSGDAATQGEFIRVTRAYEALKAALELQGAQQRQAG